MKIFDLTQELVSLTSTHSFDIDTCIYDHNIYPYQALEDSSNKLTGELIMQFKELPELKMAFNNIVYRDVRHDGKNLKYLRIYHNHINDDNKCFVDAVVVLRTQDIKTIFSINRQQFDKDHKYDYNSTGI